MESQFQFLRANISLIKIHKCNMLHLHTCTSLDSKLCCAVNTSPSLHCVVVSYTEVTDMNCCCSAAQHFKNRELLFHHN